MHPSQILVNRNYRLASGRTYRVVAMKLDGRDGVDVMQVKLRGPDQRHITMDIEAFARDAVADITPTDLAAGLARNVGA